MIEILPADLTDRLVAVTGRIRSRETVPFHNELIRFRFTENRLQAHEVRSVHRLHIQIRSFIRFRSCRLLHCLHQAVCHDPVSQGGRMVFVGKEAFRRQFLADVGVESVLDGNHHQVIVLPDLLQFILQVEPVPEHRKQQDHRRLIRRVQDFLHHGFKAPVPGRLLPVIHGKLNHHDIRQSVRVRTRHPVHNLPLITHITKGRRRSAHTRIDKTDIGAVLRAVGLLKPVVEPGCPAVLISAGSRAFRNGSADGGQRDYLTALCPGDDILQPGVVSRAHDGILQCLEVPFLFKHCFLCFSPCGIGPQQHQHCQRRRPSFHFHLSGSPFQMLCS